MECNDEAVKFKACYNLGGVYRIGSEGRRPSLPGDAEPEYLRPSWPEAWSSLNPKECFAKCVLSACVSRQDAIFGSVHYLYRILLVGDNSLAFRVEDGDEVGGTGLDVMLRFLVVWDSGGGGIDGCESGRLTEKDRKGQGLAKEKCNICEL